MDAGTILSTSDIDEEVLSDLQKSLPKELPVEVDSRRFVFKSVEPPSWISFIAQADWWVQGLAAYAALYVAEIVKEAAKDTWSNRGKIVAGAIGTKNALFQLAKSLFQAKSSCQPHTYRLLPSRQRSR